MGLSVVTVLMMLASALLVARNTDVAIGAVWIMTKVIIVGFLTLQLVDTPRKINLFLWTNVVGMIWSIKTILYLGIAGGGVKEDVRVDVGVGQGGGANYLAMILVMTLPLFFVKFLNGVRWEKRFSMLMGPIYVLCVVLTGSRGGFLALFITAFYVVMRSNRKGLGIAAMLVSLVIFAAALPEKQWDRLISGFQSGEKRDFSASSRLMLWRAGWRMFTESPILGKGPDNFQILSPRYAGFYAGDTARRYVSGVEGRGFVTHSTWFQTLAEGGLSASVPFFAIFVLAFVSLHRVRRIRIRDPVVRRQIFGNSIAIEGLWVAFIVASTFGSHIKIDFLWWYMGLTSALVFVAEAEARKELPGRRAEPVGLVRAPVKSMGSGGRR